MIWGLKRFNQTYALMNNAHAGIIKNQEPSTLESALFRLPQVVLLQRRAVSYSMLGMVVWQM